MMMADATILVVDDEPELRDIFSIWLKRQGAAVLSAENGADALDILTNQKVDVLVSDVRMPIMDGVTLVRSLREMKLEFLPTIFVSGFSDVAPRELYGLGVEAMLVKPLVRSQLVDALTSTLRDRKELWLEPLADSPADRIVRDFSSLDAAAASHQFSLGRGGCCVHCPNGASKSPVNFHLEFHQDGISLDGQGIVRWYDANTEHVGIEFVYLAPDARHWVHSQPQSTSTSAYIPAC